MKEEFAQINQKLDRIDEKLDNHLTRLTKAETDVSWIKGHLKISLGFVITIITSLIAYYLTERN